MLKFLWRLIVLPFGFLLGAMAAAAVLISLGSERLTHVISSDSEMSMAETWELTTHVLVLTSAMTVVPALILVVVGEVARIRSVYYYVIGGGAALATVPLIAKLGEAGTFTIPSASIWQIFATAGFCGGFVFWLIAGRSA